MLRAFVDASAATDAGIRAAVLRGVIHELVHKSLTVTLHLRGENTLLRGVPQLLYSVVYNLCDNAIKYHRPNGEVWIQVSQSGDEVFLRVKDNGIGIPKEYQNRIFERFYRVDKSRSKDVGGTGLGLSIVKHAVLIHRGRILVDSEPGVGTEFSVALPRK